MDELLAWLHAASWSVHVGGALTMEWVLRHAQRTMPPSQVAEVCKNAGMRYRWVALGALLAAGATGLLMLLSIDDAELAGRIGNPALDLGDEYGRTLLVLAVAWFALLFAVCAMAFWAHPAQRRRSHPSMSKDEIKLERQRVGQAIQTMDRILKFELILGIVAIGLGASLNAGGFI
ncbi:MAG TPA: CopD family protein [Dehalococcoidia bacterium]|nr:CopD family protein [Dehalococcoidia bacterium]